MRAGLAIVILLLGACAAPTEAPPQPIPFDHALHSTVQLDDGPLTCATCHPGATTGAHATLPSLQTCLRCHMKPQGNPPSELESTVRTIAASGEPFHWIQVTHNPGHVYFSHRAHTAIAGMACTECHGDVTTWTRPPTLPNPRLTTMDACLSCHRERHAPTDCDTCHQ